MLLQNRPRPRIRFSEKSSGITFLILRTLTRLTIPVMDLRSASQDNRWYSALALSFDAASCRARKRAGGIYTPPERVPISLANSAFASNSFSFSFPLFSLLSNFSNSIAATRAARAFSRSARRSGSTSTTRGTSTKRGCEGGEPDRRRIWGGASEFSGEGDLGSLFSKGFTWSVSAHIPLTLLKRSV